MQSLELSVDAQLDEVRALVDALHAWESVEAIRGGNQPPAVHSNVARIAGQLYIELQNVLILVAITTSITNALECGTGQDLPEAAINAFCPSHSPIFDDLMQQLMSECNDITLCGSLQAFDARLRLAQRLSQHFQARIATKGCHTVAEIEILSDAWRRTCTSALRLIDLFKAFVEPNGGLRRSEPETRLIEILLKAEGGGTPCMGTHGGIEIPGWAERRRESRIQIRQLVIATIGNRSHEVTIHDASQRGLGLVGAANTGQHVTLTLSDGRKITGTVVWSQEGRFGMRLDLPLTLADPLLVRN